MSIPLGNTGHVPKNSAGQAPGNQERLDEAYRFLTTTTVTEAEKSDVDLNKLYRGIDWRILPVMFCCYTLQFLDKVVLNYAAVMGLTTDLGLRGNDFSNVSTFTFVAIVLAEVPNGPILNKVPAGKWLGINVILWGIATACVAASTGFKGLLAARIFLGIFEASIGPCLIIISGQWYTKPRQPWRFAIWYTGLGFGQIVGAFTSFGFQHVNKPGFVGWRIMFLTLGCITIAAGIITLFAIPDTPMNASWMTDAEKAALLEALKENRTGVLNTKFEPSQLWDLAKDPQIYMLMVMLALLSTTAGVTTVYSATLLRNAGYNPKQAALLNAPSGAISIAATLVGGYGVSCASSRWVWIPACVCPAIAGGVLMSFLPSKGGILAGIYLVNTTVATLPIIYQWTAANVAGHTKRPVAMALVAASFGLGNIIGPQTFQSRDAPQYYPAKITVLVTLAAGALVAPSLSWYYWCQNRNRRALLDAHAEGTRTASDHVLSDALEVDKHDAATAEDDTAWKNCTDRENMHFEYTL
ncbi:Thiamine pathway transporter-like protein 7 [Elsinoe fawcettii]|nr:Thiamine pathway transporter-like protein 7 [Elsinoe fawcettii]